MFEGEISKYAQILADSIITMEFDDVLPQMPYYHMGATITDSILQAGLNYRYVVFPRVQKLICRFRDYNTTRDFIILMHAFSLGELINWRDECKLTRIRDLSYMFYENGIENENQLAIWMDESNNIIQLRKISGIGPKTVDYLRMLSGTQAIAVDRHMFRFLELKGIHNISYTEANQIYKKACVLLGISQYEIDKKIWQFMSRTTV